jgi:chromosome segregation ATPase
MSVATSRPRTNSEEPTVSEKSSSANAALSPETAVAPNRNDTHHEVKSPYIAEIKGLASLQDATYSVDLEKTVEDMAAIIGNMESQLNQVLSINAVLQDDLTTSKQIISELREDKVKIKKELAAIEIELPSKREMQMEMDQLVEERSSSQNRIHSLKSKIDTMNSTVEELRKQIVQVEMEKNDAVSEVGFLESNQSAVRQQVGSQEQKITRLKTEKVHHQKKIINLQDECQRAMEEKYSLLRELQEAQDILSEVSRAEV